MGDLQEKARIYVGSLFEQFTNPNLVYHNLSHTRRVAWHARDIQVHYDLSGTDAQIIQTAAWFHDIGQLFGEVAGHEKRSVLIMRRFLSGLSVNAEIIDKVAQCILVTEFPSHPNNLNEQIICDADTYHLGTKDFEEYDMLVKREMYLRGIETDNWEEKTLDFLRRHQYFTNYCQKVLNRGKEQNIALLQARIETK